MAERINVCQCRTCGALCEQAHTGRAPVLLEVNPERMYPSKGGHDVGYTKEGRRVEGQWLQPEEKANPIAYVHKLHNCHRRASV